MKGFKKRNSYIAAFQVNPEPLKKLLRIFGGSIYWYPRTLSSGNHISVWRAYGDRARGVAMTIYPFLSKKRKTQARRIFKREIL